MLIGCSDGIGTYWHLGMRFCTDQSEGAHYINLTTHSHYTYGPPTNKSVRCVASPLSWSSLQHLNLSSMEKSSITDNMASDSKSRDATPATPSTVTSPEETTTAATTTTTTAEAASGTDPEGTIVPLPLTPPAQPLSEAPDNDANSPEPEEEEESLIEAEVYSSLSHLAHYTR